MKRAADSVFNGRGEKVVSNSGSVKWLPWSRRQRFTLYLATSRGRWVNWRGKGGSQSSLVCGI